MLAETRHSGSGMNDPISEPLNTAVAAGRADLVLILLAGMIVLALLSYGAYMIGRRMKGGSEREASAQNTMLELFRDNMKGIETRFQESLKTEREWRQALKHDVDKCHEDRLKLSGEVNGLMVEVSKLKAVIANNGSK